MGAFSRHARFERAKQRQGNRMSFIGGGMVTVVLTSAVLLILGVGSGVAAVADARHRSSGWILSVVVFAVMAVGYLVGFVVFVRWVQLRRNGHRGRIRVIDAYLTHSFQNNVPIYRVKAQVLEPGPPRIAYVNVPTFLSVDPGDELDVLVDPKRPQRMVVAPSS